MSRNVIQVILFLGSWDNHLCHVVTVFSKILELWIGHLQTVWWSPLGFKTTSNLHNLILDSCVSHLSFSLTSAQTHLWNKMFHILCQQEYIRLERQLKLGQRSKVKDWPAAPPEHMAINMDFTSCLLMYKIDNLHFVQKSSCPELCLCHEQKLAFLTLERESK